MRASYPPHLSRTRTGNNVSRGSLEVDTCLTGFLLESYHTQSETPGERDGDEEMWKQAIQRPYPSFISEPM